MKRTTSTSQHSSRAYYNFETMVGIDCVRDEGGFTVHWLVVFLLLRFNGLELRLRGVYMNSRVCQPFCRKSGKAPSASSRQRCPVIVSSYSNQTRRSHPTSVEGSNYTGFQMQTLPSEKECSRMVYHLRTTSDASGVPTPSS